ncbi:MAG TPA: hypothetical protein VHE81_18190 [Lacipirellulaceae bacterium]|nr:hypothetical protein [Lacipirellulaceae bacterium]
MGQPQPAVAGNPATTPKENSPAPSNATKNPASPAAKPADDLSVEQARLADRYKRLEQVIGRLAELSESTDPRRAKVLREAIAQSRNQDINARFEATVKLLQDERLSAAATNQTELQKELDSLLSLLLKADRDKELASQRERVHKYLKELERLIRTQKGIRARTQGGDDLRGLGTDQQRLADDTGKLDGNITKTETDKKLGGNGSRQPNDNQSPKDDNKNTPGGDKGKSSNPSKPGDSSKPGKPSDDGNSQSPNSKPSGGQPSNGKSSQPNGSQSPDGNNGEQQAKRPQEPAERATNRLRAAQQQMEEALKRLHEAERKGATDRQERAVRALEEAKAELERILRQLREEEVERTLTQLTARFRKMLEMQTAVYDGTVRLDKVPVAQRTHDHEIACAGLSRQESQIVHEVDKALLVLRDDGSSVAFPEAIEQMRDDMHQVTDRLAALKVERITQSLEKDIIAALEETIAAMEQSLKDLQKKRTPPGQMPMAGQPDDMELVDKLAELRMIRSLQLRINKRTRLYGQMMQGDQAETPELLKALAGLAERQQRVYQAAADLQKGRND